MQKIINHIILQFQVGNPSLQNTIAKALIYRHLTLSSMPGDYHTEDTATELAELTSLLNRAGVSYLMDSDDELRIIESSDQEYIASLNEASTY